MKHNKKTILLILITITTLILLSTASATTDTNTTTTSSIKEKTTTTEPIVKEKNINKENKEISKTNKTQENKKTDTKTVEVNDGTSFIEAFNNAKTDSENDKYIINLNDGNYNISSMLMWSSTGSVKTLEINGNNNIINSSGITSIVKEHNIILKNLTFYSRMMINQGNITIYQSTLVPNSGYLTLTLNGTLNCINSPINYKINLAENTTVIISDDCTLGENFIIDGSGTVISNITGGHKYDGNQEINNENITDYIIIPETGNITLINCQINAKINNNGNLTIINTVISDKITNNGNLTLKNCSLSNNNMTTSGSKTDGFLVENKGNATLINCRVENNTFNYTNYAVNTVYGVIVNNAFMNIINTSTSNNTGDFILTNLGELTIDSSNFTDSNVSVILNKGNLTINNSLFERNFVGGSGGAIRSTYHKIWGKPTDSQMEISNSIFKDNRAILQSWSNYMNGGGAIFIDMTDTKITNCTFDNNTAGNEITGIVGVTSSGGSIAMINYAKDSNAKIHVIDSTFKNHNGNIIANSNPYNSFALNGTITQCVFENNSGGIIDHGNLNIINNTFKNTTNTDAVIYNYIVNAQEKNITDNNFIDNNVETDTIYTYLSSYYEGSTRPINITVNNNHYTNTTLNDKIELNLPKNIITGETITITGTYTLEHPEYYDEDILEQTQFAVYINGRPYQTLDKIEFNITPASTANMIITIEPTISQSKKSFTIKPLTNVTITPENYDEYIYNENLIGVSRDTIVMFKGEFKDKGEIVIDTSDIIIDGIQATFTNTIFKLEANRITLENMNIQNTQTDYPIKNTADNNIITGNTITLINTNGKTAAIYNKASNTEITYNTLYVDGPATDIDHSEGYGIANTQAILLIGGDKNKVEYNTIEVTTSTTSTQFGTTEAITNHKEATNTLISNNNITLTGNANFKYGINSLNNIENITITDNNIEVTGERYTDGIQIGTGAQNILIQGNNIKCICHNTTPVDEEAITYGITTVTVGEIISNNITITNNNINLEGSVNYGIELYKTNNTWIAANNLTVKGLQSIGIGLAHSPNSTLLLNNIKTYGDSNITLGQVTEEIQPANVGIQIQQYSDNAEIRRNIIQTYDKAGQDTCINIESNKGYIVSNKLTSTTKTGDLAVNGQTDTHIYYNTAIEQNSTTQTATEDLTTGDNTTLTAQFYDDTYTPIGDGKAIFRVNGKTLRDNQGNVIYADVINGRAELPNVNITQEWTKESTTIQAIYIGDDNNEPITTKPTTVTVTKPEATITLDAPTTANAGETITLKATVTDDDAAVNSGRVAFKLNGKTLKNTDGKTLYAEVRDGITTITYTIPPKTKAKEYTLTAVFTDTNYDRVEAESKLNVVKA